MKKLLMTSAFVAMAGFALSAFAGEKSEFVASCEAWIEENNPESKTDCGCLEDNADDAAMADFDALTSGASDSMGEAGQAVVDQCQKD